LCYNAHMDTTIRNLDEVVYRRLKARAALTGRTIGETVNEALRVYLATAETSEKTRSLRDLTPRPFPPGNERLSDEIDDLLDGISG